MVSVLHDKSHTHRDCENHMAYLYRNLWATAGQITLQEERTLANQTNSQGNDEINDSPLGYTYSTWNPKGNIVQGVDSG